MTDDNLEAGNEQSFQRTSIPKDDSPAESSSVMGPASRLIINTQERNTNVRFPPVWMFRSRSPKRLHCHQAKLLKVSLSIYISDRFLLKRLPLRSGNLIIQSYPSSKGDLPSTNDEDHGYSIGRNFSITSFVCFTISEVDTHPPPPSPLFLPFLFSFNERFGSLGYCYQARRRLTH